MWFATTRRRQNLVFLGSRDCGARADGSGHISARAVLAVLSGRGKRGPRCRRDFEESTMDWKSHDTVTDLLGRRRGAAVLIGWSFWNYAQPEWQRYQEEFHELVTRKFGPARAQQVPSGIQQVWVRELDRVDRCTTCHHGRRTGRVSRTRPNPSARIRKKSWTSIPSPSTDARCATADRVTRRIRIAHALDGQRQLGRAAAGR